METKANYALVGAFVLFFTAAIFAFVIWVARIGFDSTVTKYDIYFTKTVTGLKTGSTVLYRGVPVGVVESIRLDAKNVEQVHVEVHIQSDVILKQDCYASLEMQGITGMSYIQINGGKKESSLLKKLPGSSHIVIPSRSSLFEEVTDSLPSILKQISRTLEELRDIVNPENKKTFAQILVNIEETTASINPKNPKSSVYKTIEEFRETVQALRGAASTVDAFFGGTKTEAQDAMKMFKEAMAQAHILLKNNQQAITLFGETGLPAFTKFLQEGSQVFTAYRRIAESIERSPGRFFYNDPKYGVRVP